MPFWADAFSAIVAPPRQWIILMVDQIYMSWVYRLRLSANYAIRLYWIELNFYRFFFFQMLCVVDMTDGYCIISGEWWWCAFNWFYDICISKRISWFIFLSLVNRVAIASSVFMSLGNGHIANSHLRNCFNFRCKIRWYRSALIVPIVSLEQRTQSNCFAFIFQNNWTIKQNKYCCAYCVFTLIVIVGGGGNYVVKT